MLFAFSSPPGMQTEYVKHTTSRDSNTRATPSKKRCQTETTKTIRISASHEKQNWSRNRNQLRTAHKNIEPTAPRLPKRDTYTHRKDRRGRKKTYNSNILFPFSSATKCKLNMSYTRVTERTGTKTHVPERTAKTHGTYRNKILRLCRLMENIPIWLGK